ncbi:MAG: aminodeoxychorismate synthase component I [Gammaproteobacteria bacterium]|nr:aminodeoxychorismate synthase component I [Gammaproteobacteria bacterium]
MDFPADLSQLQARYPARYPYLLQSVSRGTAQARYDILFAFPGETQRLEDCRQPDFLTALDHAFLASRRRARPPLPFAGGWFLYLGYELAGQVEPTVPVGAESNGFPVALMARVPLAVVRDHREGLCWIAGERGHEDQHRQILADLGEEYPQTAIAAPRLETASEPDPEEFMAQVERVRRYVRDGDVFQLNLSRQWRARLADSLPASSLYQRLVQANPAPFAGCAMLADGRAVISSSPERLVLVDGDSVITRPIAGTWPRGRDPGQDHQWARDLLAHPKERAEHVMLIDLERNDLGRVCRPGSVRVSEFMVLESYRHVHHIVSQVEGQLNAGVLPGQVIRATFPGGTITGCPKVRCMQIIHELEGAPRQAYTGSMGYLGLDGRLDLNILIRTLVLNGRELSLRAGGGIVADSRPRRELMETRAKAKGVLASLGIRWPHY